MFLLVVEVLLFVWMCAGADAVGGLNVLVLKMAGISASRRVQK